MKRLVACLFLLLPGPLLAQGHEPVAEFSFQFQHPFLDHASSLSPLSGAYRLGAVVPLGAGQLLAEIPYAVMRSSGLDDNSLGNPMIGYGRNLHPLRVEVTARLPLADDRGAALPIGYLADLSRIEAYFPNTVSLRAEGSFEQPIAEGWTFAVHAAPALWIPTGNDSRDTELVAHYAFGLELDTAPLAAQVHLHGSRLLTEEHAEGEERQLGVDLIMKGDASRFGLHLRLPVEEANRRILDSSLGLSYTVVRR